MTPVIPPITNRYRKPVAKSIGVGNVRRPRNIVAIQLKILIPVGTAMMNDESAKNGRLTAAVVNMWWAHTDIEYAPIRTVAATIERYPNNGLRENTGTTSDRIPKNGSARM